MNEGSVCVAIVTCNSARYIQRCLNAVLGVAEENLQIVVVDNASTDNTLQILKEFAGRIEIIANPCNRGFAEAQNQAIRGTSTAWVLTLNPDVLLQPGFIPSLLEAAAADPRAGAVCGKLLSIGPGFEPLRNPQIDSAGIFFTPAMRHFDRGWHEPDCQQFERMEYVFGASAAAALFRREMIDDISIDGNFFDPDFFVYREDADIAWRAQLQGWRCLYTPHAVGHHVRTVTPENRRGLPVLINRHSVKNRFLMRVKNVTPAVFRRFWRPMTMRDLVVIGGSLFWEPSSLPAFWYAAKCLPRAIRHRRIIMQRRRITDDDLAAWFDFSPASRPVGHPAEIGTRKTWTARRPVAGPETAGL